MFRKILGFSTLSSLSLVLFLTGFPHGFTPHQASYAAPLLQTTGSVSGAVKEQDTGMPFEHMDTTVNGAGGTAWQMDTETVLVPVPTLLAPADGTLTNERIPLFDWTDEAGAVRYNIVVDDDPTFSSPRFSVYPVASAYKPFVTPLADGVWYWHVRTLGMDGGWSDFSDSWFLTVDATRPGRPTLTGPANGDIIEDNMPAFTWTNPGDGVSYHILMDMSPFFRSASKIEGYSNTTSWIPDETTKLDDGRWYWRVQATDAAGNTGLWSVTFSVFINAIETPIPALVSPQGDLLTRDRVFTFDWTDEAGVKKYNLQVNTAEDFSGVMRINVSPVASEFRNSAIPLSNWTWYWRVRALGTDNIWGKWSDVRMIQVDLFRPTHPTLTTPAFNEMLDTSTPTFSWLESDVDVAEYILQIDHNIYFSSADLKHYTGISTTSYTIPDSLDDGRWYWRVAAVDAVGNVSFWSANSRVFVNAILTSIPTLIAPEDGLLIGSPVYLFDWTDEEGVNLYNIQVYSSPDFDFGKRVHAHPTASEFLNTPRPLPSGTWYWRVRARGTDGLWGDYSEVRVLYVDLARPSPPTQASPLNNTTVATSTPTLTWNASADADVVGYVIQIDKTYYFRSAERIQEQVVGTTYTPSEPLVDQRWFWRIAAVDAAGNQSGWSWFWSFIVDTTTTTSTENQVIRATSPQVQRAGQWQRYTVNGSNYLASSGESAALSLTFTGSQLEVHFAKHNTLGTFAIEIDGQVVQTVNSHTSTLAWGRVAFPLTPGEHTVRVVSLRGSVVISDFAITP